MDLGQLAGLPLALKAAIELLSSSQIVDQIPARSPKAVAVTLERVLRLLASNSVLTSTRNVKGRCCTD
ncbi:hypothetical protein H6P81_008354 [Aristolochia fimbriata]|uniref:Plant methyltransferase dimerisation domain-containing protein n=1 Tax=Aristolochia fimbriata TaxID=158543 RepID=A0AAV7F2S2_ARIFI|nr:hypothetical protein H6P81_008354 [Aristolochia fimbriata]